MFTTRIVRRSFAVGALLAVVLVGAACGDDESVETITSVLDAGDAADTVDLPPTPVEGQTASGRLEMTMDMSLSSGAQDVSVDMTMTADMTSSVLDVSEDGGHVQRFTIDAFEAESSEASVASELERAMPAGLTYEETYNADGAVESREIVDVGDLSDSEREAAEEFVSQLDSASLTSPAAPVGVGGRWATTNLLTSGGGAFEMVLIQELTDLTDTAYGVDMSIDSDVDTNIDGEHMTGTVSGSGTLTGSRDNPLVTSSDMTIAIDIGGGGVTMSLSTTMSYDFTDGQN